jgi:hypothetical protein
MSSDALHPSADASSELKRRLTQLPSELPEFLTQKSKRKGSSSNALEDEDRESKLSKKRSKKPPALPLKVNPADFISSPSFRAGVNDWGSLGKIKNETPWNKYERMDVIKRGRKADAARSKDSQSSLLVVIHKLEPHHLNQSKVLLDSHDVNLVELLEIYRFEDLHYVVTEYTVVCLHQIIAIELTLQERHISTICGQVGYVNLRKLQGSHYVDFCRYEISIKAWPVAHSLGS